MSQALPGAAPVVDRFPGVGLARDGLDRCRQRIRQGQNRPGLEQGAGVVLAFLDRPGVGNSPTTAIDGSLEHLGVLPSARRTSSTTSPRSLLESGGS